MDDYGALIGRDVYGKEGEKIGTVDKLYVSGDSREPVFATVKTGWFAGSSFIPLANAQMDEDGIEVPYTKDQVKDAPNVEADQELEPDEENRLYEHYSIDRGGQDEGDRDDESDEDDEDYDDENEEMNRRERAGEASQSGEQSDTGGRSRNTSHYRLHEYVVTDVITRTIPVEHEEVPEGRTKSDENSDDRRQ